MEETLITAASNKITFKEIWRFRELFYFLAWRDVKVRFKQTLLGVGWALLQPLLTVLVFSFLFGRVAQVPSDGVPYSLFALVGLMPWIFFLNGVTNSSNSVVSDANLIKKVYFPRIIIPFASVSASLIDLLLTFLIVLVMAPSIKMLLFPFLALYLYITTVGLGVWLSALNALFRDIKHIVPFFLQLWLFVTPVVYPMSMIPEKWKMVVSLNPMVGVVEAFRWMALNHSPEPFLMVISMSISCFIFVTGILFFRKIESHFADVV